MPAGFVLVVKTASHAALEKKELLINEYAHGLSEIPEFEELDLATVNYCLYK